MALGYSIDDLLPPPNPGSEPTPSNTNNFTDGASPAALGSGELQGNTTVTDGYLQSDNYVAATSGWKLSPTDAELNISTALLSLDIPDTTTANSFHVDSAGNAWWGTNVATGYATAPASVLKTGAATFSSVTITGGAITGTPIASIPNDTSTDISLLEGTHDLVFSVTDKDTVAWATGTITLSNGRTFSISSGNTGNMAARTYIYLDTGVSSTVLQTTTTVSTAIGANKKLIAVAQNGSAQAQYTVYGGIGGLKLPASGTSISNNNWIYSGAFSVTDADTIAWASGTLTTSDGGSYSITGANTGNMAATTYVYFDLGTSSTAFQTTTTAATAIGDGKILIAICKNGTNEASYLLVNSNSYNIDAANIVAGSISANEIAAGAVTATKINVSQLSAITADMGALTAGTVTLDTSGYVRGGATDYLTGTGFFLGYSGAAYKFSVGNPSGSYIGWDGSTLTIIGNQVIVNTYTSNDTWTKPTGAKFVTVEVWGGGAGGSSNGGGTPNAGGGGGGLYATAFFNASQLASTETVTVGAAAAAATAGNTSSFGSWISAYGGGTSTAVGGGGGGGIVANGADGGADGGAGGGPSGGTGGVTANGGDNSGFGGGGGGDGGGFSGGSSVYGGGGGGGGNTAGNTAGNGGNSVYGGGGGGGAATGAAGSGGTSKVSGAGGAGVTSGTGVAGTAPSGGGGGGGTGGAGARGQVRVTTYL